MEVLSHQSANSSPNSRIPPPLPLFEFQNESSNDPPPQNIWGSPLKNIKHDRKRGVEDDIEPLGDPVQCYRLAAWFSHMEAERKIELEKNESEDQDIEKGTLIYHEDEEINEGLHEISFLQFDSRFESGNLHRVYETNLQNPKPHPPDSFFSSPPDIEYDMFLRKDTHSNGNIQWFYFKVTSSPECHGGIGGAKVIRFNICNMMKKDSLFNYGMRPLIYNEDIPNDGWRRGGTDICYYKSQRRYAKKKGKKKTSFYYTLTFTLTIPPNSTLFFAYCYPYTYSNLLNDICDWMEDSRIRKILRRRTLTKTLAGNKMELLTITEEVTGGSNRPAIIVSARIHPGESQSSWMMRGIIQFLLNDTAEARVLRRLFIFKLVFNILL